MTYSATLDLGPITAVIALFSYPNDPASPDTPLQVVEHWIGQSLLRDGLAPAVSCTAQLGAMGEVLLTIRGPDSAQSQIDRFLERLHQFHQIGYRALTTVVPALK